MNPDREPSRLPYRAGAMLLVAIAVVCIVLGWHSAVTKKSDPEAALQAAQSKASTTTSQSAAASPGASSAASTSSSAVDAPPVCVFNAGTITGLAAEVSETLKNKGYTVASTRSLVTSSITENTVFYRESQRDAAQQIVDTLGGSATLDERPTAFTQCATGIPVVVVTR
ncbi:LytR C-terminal domain-containing protein [Williamsia sterculiae]|uniref:LytR cell envelope-related transcriptional attenuator n=1 Tax=Williamsia sterculiae TaxID=1344003 RepID=A0A1N7F102_9NOCA|nr:LytR C-terminal domain-containing protein [Williamsia sterculiae]SIR93885.1 LytR cell envelope-related transcriptional attenuator [Williamsia sterculiae]